ncbi:MAG: DUF3298 domain-containing protein [Bacillota bacterium]|nr:DUF3298 domain-containing protein [Bacillota bacterium]
MSSTIPNPVQIITRKMMSANQVLSIDYPWVILMPNINVQNKINNSILHLVNKLIVDQGYYQNPVTTMMGWYELKNNQKAVLSLSLGNYTYFYHAAHGMTVIKSLTFSTDDGKSYSLGEMFKPGRDYVKILSDIVAKQIELRKIDLLGEFKGISPDQDFYIADKCLVIYFQLYEITPYAEGFQFFPISVYEIQDIIKEGSPLDIMTINE